MTKKWIIVFFLIGLWIPFIFLQDFFPFFRFGMFAEPIRHQAQYEQFIVRLGQKGKPKKVFEPETLCLNKAHWDLLWRNHHYRRESTETLSKLAKTVGKTDWEWELVRLRHLPTHTDSIVVGHYANGLGVGHQTKER